MRVKLAVAMLVLLGLAVATAQAQDASTTSNKPASPMIVPNASVAAGSTYVIGPDDVLTISVWKDPDLTSTLPVRPDGNISLPLLNDVQAAGLTPMQLAAAITERLKKYIGDPRVTVVVKEINSKKIYVTGEVQHTGGLQMQPGMTVLQALADAGFTQFANTKRIYVLRTENGVEQKIPVNYKRLVKGQAGSQDIVLKPGDTIVVP
jgi:polysaccharide export outer membrane protein